MNGAMHLVLRSTGGFTGPAGAATRTVELSTLSAALSDQLRRLVQACDFFALPSSLLKTAPQSWDFLYTLRIEADGRAHTVSYHLDAAPAALRELTAIVDARPAE